jgi:hypothetical protein
MPFIAVSETLILCDVSGMVLLSHIPFPDTSGLTRRGIRPVMRLRKLIQECSGCMCPAMAVVSGWL